MCSELICVVVLCQRCGCFYFHLLFLRWLCFAILFLFWLVSVCSCKEKLLLPVAMRKLLKPNRKNLQSVHTNNRQLRQLLYFIPVIAEWFHRFPISRISYQWFLNRHYIWSFYPNGIFSFQEELLLAFYPKSSYCILRFVATTNCT